jgi:hypothetical protein
MAELPLAIVGIVLAWKNIVDFGELMTKITNDDARQREGLWLRLEVSQYRLKDWGDDWGIDHIDGRFHRFEPTRKELIKKIIFRLQDSRLKALEPLRDRYGLAADEDDQEEVATKDRLSRLMSRVKTASKRVKDKTMWLAHDQERLSELVNETVELQELLQYLTYGSGSFILNALPHVQSAPSPEAGLRQLDHSGRASTRIFKRSLASSSNSAALDVNEQVDERTLASFAIKTIVSSRQAELVQQQIEQAFHFQGDSRIPEIICEWWNDDSSRLLVLETLDISDDRTAASTCSLVYYLASCHRLVYSFQNESSERPVQQFFDMLKTLILGMVFLLGNTAQRTTPFSFTVADIKDQPMNDNNMQQLVNYFKNILLELSSRSGTPILVIMDGLEVFDCEESDNHMIHLRSLFQDLQAICDQDKPESNAIVKVLLGYKGHAMVLYDWVKAESIVDVTSLPTNSTSLMQELALKLNVTDTQGDLHIY